MPRHYRGVGGAEELIYGLGDMVNHGKDSGSVGENSPCVVEGGFVCRWPEFLVHGCVHCCTCHETEVHHLAGDNLVHSPG